MTVELKIKAKHLALEPQIIRFEEKKLKKRIKHHRSGDEESSISLTWKLHSLTNHRKINVRNESRATHLARTYLAGKPYVYCERKRNDNSYFTMYIVPRVLAMVTKYGKGEQRKATKETIVAWANVKA
jgi:hypothetical protein